MEENLFHVYFLYFLKNQNEQQSLRTKKPSNPLSSFVFPIYPIVHQSQHPFYTLNPPNPKESQTESRQKPSIIFFFLFDSQRCFEFSRLKARRTERKKRKTDRALSRASLAIAFDDWGSWKGRGGKETRGKGKGKEITRGERGTLAKEYFNRWKKRWKREERRGGKRVGESTPRKRQFFPLFHRPPPPPAPPPILEVREGEQAEKNNPIQRERRSDRLQFARFHGF